MFGHYSEAYQGKRTVAELRHSAERHHYLAAPIKVRKVANNTIEFYLPSSTGLRRYIQLHDTEILTFFPDGAIQLNSGGWRSMTTSRRMNEFLPTGWQVFADRGRWYVSTPAHPGLWDTPRKDRIVFRDGIIFNADGTLERRA